MPKSIQLLLGFFTLLPVACIAFFLVALILFSQEKTVDNAVLSLINVVIFVRILPVSLVPFFIVAMYYVLHAMGDERLTAFEKVGWVFILVFTVGIASPLYWLIRIWESHRSYTENKDSKNKT